MGKNSLPLQRRTRPRWGLAVFLLTVGLTYWLASAYFVHASPFLSRRSQRQDQHSKPHRQPLPVILPKSDDRPYRFYDAGHSYHDMNFTCPVEWEWTTDREAADVIWYDILGGYPSSAEDVARARPRPDQLLAFYSLESGVHYNIVYNTKKIGFNFSVDYRIWPGHPEGLPDIPAVYLLNPTMPTFSIDFRRPPPLPKRKDAYVAAFISNCNAANNRMQVLKELMDLIPVHSYGACFHNADEPANDSGQRASMIGNSPALQLGGEYHFVFAPENANEVGYVTEKVYKALAMGSVPIYLGAPDVGRYIPHPSAIVNVGDFKTTADLADHLKSLVEDEEAYLKKYEWKKREFSPDFQRVLRLATRTVHCRLAMKLAGLDFEEDQQNLKIFSLSS